MSLILWFSDTQLRESVPTEHLKALCSFIEEKAPDVVVCGGDHYDIPSLSNHHNAASIQGQSLRSDISFGDLYLEMIESSILEVDAQAVYLEGNHENRLWRFLNENPQLDGALKLPRYLEQESIWDVYRYLEPAIIDNIVFQHCFANLHSPRILGGNISSMLKTLGHSFVAGHAQRIAHEKIFRPNGRVDAGLICGAFHLHYEAYRTDQNAQHWNGICLLHTDKTGDYDVEAWSIERLMREYL